MTQDKKFYDIQNKTIESVKVTLAHFELRTISSELAMTQIKEAITNLDKRVAEAVNKAKEQPHE